MRGTALAILFYIMFTMAAQAQVDRHRQVEYCFGAALQDISRIVIIPMNIDERRQYFGLPPFISGDPDQRIDLSELFSQQGIAVGLNELRLVRRLAGRRIVLPEPSDEGARVVVAGIILVEARFAKLPDGQLYDRMSLSDLQALERWVSLGGMIPSPRISRGIFPFACAFLASDSKNPITVDAFNIESRDWRLASEIALGVHIHDLRRDLQPGWRQKIFERLGNVEVSRPPHRFVLNGD